MNHIPVEFMTELYEAFLNIPDKETAENFLNDLCTAKELEQMAQRVRAAKLLLEGKTYQQVIQETDISSATLSRVSRCIQYGEGGYASVLKTPSAGDENRAEKA